MRVRLLALVALFRGSAGLKMSANVGASDADKYALKGAPAGSMERPAMKFRARVGESPQYPAAAGRYRLYLSYACPWAHRCAVVRGLKGLEGAIPVTWTGFRLANFQPPYKDYHGWEIPPGEAHGFTHLDELYEHAAPGYRASFGDKRPSFTVPVLFDEETQTIVSTESADIIASLNSAFNAFATRPDLDLAPADLAAEMERVDSVVYPVRFRSSSCQLLVPACVTSS